MNERKQSNRRPPRAKEMYLLSGKLICGECGYAMYGQKRRNGETSKLYTSYICGQKDRKHNCRNKEIQRDLLDAFVLNELSDHIFDESKIKDMVKGYRQHQIESHAEQTHELEAIRKRLKVVSREANNIVDLMAKTASTRLIERLNELEHEEVENKHRLEQLEATIQITHVDEKEFKKMFRTARKLFKTGTLPTTKRLIDMFVDKIIIHSDHVEVMLKISPKFHSHESLPKDENEHNMGLLPIKKCAGYDGGEGGI